MVGMQICAPIMEISVDVPQELETNTPYEELSTLQLISPKYIL